MVAIYIKRLTEEAKLPEYKTEGAAGADLYSAEQTVLGAGERLAIRCGIALELPPGYEGQIRPRSGIALSAGITVLNSPGTVDSDFRGEIKVILYNTSTTDFSINKGDRIAQLIISPVTRAGFYETRGLGETIRGTGGFGSTGV